MKLPSRLTVLTAALLVLLPALAVLQFRWVGELGNAARERMRRNLHNAAEQFRESFDTEVARAFLSLQVDSTVVRDEAWSRYAERYAAWASTAAHPKLVANVYVVDASRETPRLRRWDAEGRTFVEARWEGAFEALRSHFAADLAAFNAGEPRRPVRRSDREHEALLIAPLISIHVGLPPRPQTRGLLAPVFGFTVIELNLPLIREQMLPALAHRHFSQTDDDSYRVAVVDAADPRTVIYRSSPDAPDDPSRADVVVPMFAAHHDPLMFLGRGSDRDSGDRREKRQLVFSMIREQRDANVTVRLSGADEGRWRLLAQHRRGSLEAAVGDMRKRNLVISFGILLLMGVSMGLLTVSSRRAQQLAQQRMEFVAGVSHELRTPVAVIRSAAENLSEGVVDDPERVRRYGDAIQVEARRLGEMVERVLHFAGIDAGRTVQAPLALEPLIEEAIHTAVPADGEPFTVERHIASDLPAVAGDATAVRSAIQNLIANAVKYGGADRWIRVRAEAGRQGFNSFMATGERGRIMLAIPRHRRRQPPEVRITIEDHGGGISPSDLPHIFDPFYRGAGAISRQIQGSGLGLALVRRIAEAHKGHVSVVTREGGGSAFTLHLPAAASTPEAAPLQSPHEAAAG